MRLSLTTTWLALGLVLLGWLSAAAASELPDHPLTLDECIALARERNPSLTIARQDLVSAEANVRQSLSSYYPTASLIATYGRTAGSSFVETAAGSIPVGIATRRRESEVLLSQVLWQSGRGESVNQTRRALNAARASQETARQDLVLSVSQLYYAALAAEQLVAVSEATLTAARDHEKLVKARAGVGESPPIDVIPAAADVAEAELALLQAQNDADLGKARLKSEIGLPPTYRLRLAGPEPGDGEGALPSLAEAVEVSMQKRPDAAALRESVEAARHGLRLARTLERGVLGVNAQYERGISGPREGTSWAAVASATVFLFDGGGRQSEVELARASLASLEAQEQQLRNTIGLEVESALLDVATASKSMEASAKTVASAEAQLAAAEVKYREGAGIFVEILDAQKAVARARTNRVRAMYGYQTALVALGRAMGMLTPPAAEPAP